MCMHRNLRLFNSHPLNYMQTVTFWVFGFNQEKSDSLQISICKKRKEKKERHMAKGSFVPFLVWTWYSFVIWQHRLGTRHSNVGWVDAIIAAEMVISIRSSLFTELQKTVTDYNQSHQHTCSYMYWNVLCILKCVSDGGCPWFSLRLWVHDSLFNKSGVEQF